MSDGEGMPASAIPAILAIAANCSGLNMTDEVPGQRFSCRVIAGPTVN